MFWIWNKGAFLFIDYYMTEYIGQNLGSMDMSALHAGTRQWSNIIDHRRHIDEVYPHRILRPMCCLCFSNL